MLSIRSFVLASAFAVAPLVLSAQATVTCKDGTTSTATGRGTCSGHGGVAKKTAGKSAKTDAKVAKTDAKADAKVAKTEAKASDKVAKTETKAAAKETKAETKSATKSAKASNATVASARGADNTDPTNATAKCKDGTYSHAASRRGACSRHGGVAEWLKS